MKNNKPDISLIRKYLNGELDAAAMYQLERQAQEDPLLMDMMQGMEMGDRARDERNLQDIENLITRRVQSENSKTARIIPWKTWAVAASLVLVSSIAGLWIFRTSRQEKLQQDQTVQLSTIRQKPVEQQITGRDSVTKDHTVNNLDTEPKALADQLSVDAVLAKRSRSRVIVQEKKVAGETVMKGIPDSAIKGDLARLDQRKEFGHGDLNEVVAIGYSTQKKAMSPASSSVAAPKPDSFRNALEGKIAGQNADAIIDSMNSSKEGLSEVVMTGIGVAKRASQPVVKPVILGKAHPAIGWDAYNLYLKENASVPDGSRGIVTVAFMIGVNGNPDHVMVVKSLNEAADRKAVSLVRNGAKWVGDPAELEKIITLKIKFR